MNCDKTFFENDDRSSIVRCFHVCKHFGEGRTVFNDASYLASGNGVSFILGPGGSGKSTFVKLLAGMETPQDGQIWIGDKNLGHLPPKEAARLRRRLGIVMQEPKLMMDETVAANIALPLEIAGMDRSLIEKKVHRIARAIGLESKKAFLCRYLSTSERRLTAVGRACVTDPFLLLADEPASQLDEHARKRIALLFDELNVTGSTVLIVSRDNSFPSMFPGCHIAVIEEGRIEKKATLP